MSINHFDAGIFEGFWRPLWEVLEDILVYFFEIVFMIDFYVLKASNLLDLGAL